MTPDQISLVQDSFLYVLPIPDETASTFYQRLFALAPDTRALFKNDMVAQGRKLVLTLSAVVNGLDRLDEIVPIARELAQRHVGYGALPRHYDAVGTALLATLAELLGPGFDEPTEQARAAAYQLLATVMLDASRLAA